MLGEIFSLMWEIYIDDGRAGEIVSRRERYIIGYQTGYSNHGYKNINFPYIEGLGLRFRVMF